MNTRKLFLFALLVPMCAVNAEDVNVEALQENELFPFTKEQSMKAEKTEKDIPNKYTAFKENDTNAFITLIQKDRELISPIDESIGLEDVENSKKLLFLKRFQHASIENYRNEHWNPLYIGFASAISGWVGGALLTVYFFR